MRLLFLLLLFVATQGIAQCKSFTITDNGDTLNCIDAKDQKQGKWAIKVLPRYGEPGYEEEGEFINDKKEGLWRVFNLMGDLTAEENYKWGYKNGISKYFNYLGLEREESWRAVNPENPYDTFDVPDPAMPYKFDKVVVKLDGKTLKDGIWKYYRSGSTVLLRTETYKLDQLVDPDVNSILGNNEAAKRKAYKIPKEVEEFEKRASKKSIRVRDGSTKIPD